MSEIVNFWKLIVESNTFNFIVLMIIFAVLFKKLNISNTIEQVAQEISKAIENVKKERETAKNKLINAQKSIENLDNDIHQRLLEAEERANGISKQIEENTNSQIELIEKNIKRVILAEEKTLSAQMTEKTLKTSVEIAKKQIINMLKNSPELHNKFIDESIENIDKV